MAFNTTVSKSDQIFKSLELKHALNTSALHFESTDDLISVIGGYLLLNSIGLIVDFLCLLKLVFADLVSFAITCSELSKN